MTKNLVEHEQINLHISKTVFYGILRSIVTIPLAIYLIASQWLGSNLNYGCTEWDGCIQWFDLGIISNSLILSFIIIIMCIAFIRNGFNIYRWL